MMMAKTTSSPMPPSGIRQLPVTMVEKNSSATSTAMIARKSRAGMTALTSVYPAPWTKAALPSTTVE